MIPFLKNKKVWGFPYLKIEKLRHSHFMFFDRYEIQIQAFVDSINAIFIICRSSSPQNMISKWDTHFNIWQINKQRTKRCLRLSRHFEKSNMLILIFTKWYVSMMSPDFFLICSGVLVSPKISKDGCGARRRVGTLRNH